MPLEFLLHGQLSLKYSMLAVRILLTHVVDRVNPRLFLTSKPFNHQQWSQDGKRVKGADQTRPRVMMTGEGRWAASSLHAVSFPTDPFPFLSPFSRLVHALVLRSLRSLRMRAERVRRENAKRDGMGTRNQE